MSVIVRDMEMPTNCLECSFVRIVSDHHYCGCNANCMLGEYVGEYLEGVCRHEGCPLAQLPEKHGRLGDLDEVKTAFPCGESVRTECVRATIDNMPTIVEAEG